MRRHLFAFLIVTFTSSLIQAQAVLIPTEVTISSSGSGPLKVVTYEAKDAQGTVVMPPGGSWNVGSIDASTGALTGTNFFIRTIPLFVGHALNVVTMYRPDSLTTLRDAALRSGQQHGQDVLTLADYASRLNKPVWLLGTSLGAISAVNAATLKPDAKISGLVISSAVANKTSVVKAGTLDFPLEKIVLPVYVSGHEKDECASTPPATTREIARRLTRSRKVELKLTQTGSNPTGNPCGPTHWHGYINAEEEVVKQMAEFIKQN
jgi:hypothetical protein